MNMSSKKPQTISVKEETLYLHQIDIKCKFDFWEQFRKTMTFSESLMEMFENKNGPCLPFCPLLQEYVESKWIDVQIVKHQEKNSLSSTTLMDSYKHSTVSNTMLFIKSFSWISLQSFKCIYTYYEYIIWYFFVFLLLIL